MMPFIQPDPKGLVNKLKFFEEHSWKFSVNASKKTLDILRLKKTGAIRQ